MSIKITSLDQLIESYLICGMTEGKSPKTTDFYSFTLKRFSRFLKIQNLNTLVDEIGITETRQFIFYLQNNAIRWEGSQSIRDDKPLSPFSIQAYVRTIKAFWTWLFHEGFITSNTMSALKIPKAPRKIELLAILGVVVYPSDDLKFRKIKCQLDLAKVKNEGE